MDELELDEGVVLENDTNVGQLPKSFKSNTLNSPFGNDIPFFHINLKNIR